ncbi:histidine kinase [Eisenbergiella sp.]
MTRQAEWWKRLTGWWEKQGLKNKILLICIPGAIFSSVVIMVLASFIFREYEKNMYNITVQNLNMIIRHIEMELQEADGTSVEIITDATVQAALSRGKPNVRSWEVSMDYIRQLRALYEVLQDQLRISRNIVSISIFVDDEWYYVGSSRRSYDRSRLAKMRESLADNSSEITWYVTGYPANRIYGLRSVRDLRYHTFEDLALLVIEYDLEGSIEGLLKNNSNVRYSPDLAVMDGEKLLYSDIAALPSRELEQRGSRNYRSVSLNGKKYFASWLDGTDYGWSYVFLILYDDLFGMMRFLKIVFWGVVAAVLGLSVFYCEKLTGLITRRFTYLTGRMKSVQEGNFRAKSRRGEGRQDELEQICDRFEEMVGHVDRLIQDNYVKQMLIRENQLKVLQNQVNPHFLFNTLQTINWKARENHQETISQITEALGRLLRYTLRENNEPALLREEIGILRHYVTIQKIRYQERLQVSVDIPEALMERRIPKLSLQNIVENSVKYALENMLEPCSIEVWAECRKDIFHLYVRDNGPGISPEVLRRIGGKAPEVCREREDGVQEDEAQEDEAQGVSGAEETGGEAGLGIGLANIRQRIMLLFDTGSDLLISNTGEGTLTEIRITGEKRAE